MPGLEPVTLMLGLLAACCAHAGLGDDVTSIQHDHAALRNTTLAVTAAAQYEMHETSGAGGSVREYTSKSGAVFAVAWSGRTQPDLSVVLSNYYTAYFAAASEHRGNHHQLSISTPALELNMMKLPRGFSGVAYVPALLPAGLSLQEIR